MFAENPLGDDGLVRLEYERYEKARIEKKLKDLILFKGYNSSNKLKDLDKLLLEYKKNEDMPKFRFDNETRNNKDTFDRYEKTSRYSLGGSSQINQMNNLSNMNMFITHKEYILDTYSNGTLSASK